MNPVDLAERMVTNTRENMPGWHGQVLGSVRASGTEWQLVRREGQGKCVVSAFGVRGNTTALVSLVAVGAEARHVPNQMNAFRAFVGSVKFVKTDISEY